MNKTIALIIGCFFVSFIIIILSIELFYRINFPSETFGSVQQLKWMSEKITITTFLKKLLL